MRFFAKLNPNGHIHKEWRSYARVSGDVSHVRFRLVKGEYVSDELNPEQITAFQTRQDTAVFLETLGVLPGSAKQQGVEDVAVEQQEQKPRRRRRLPE